MIHESSAASTDTRLRRAVSPFSPSTYRRSMPQGFTLPCARLTSRLHAFATNLHESCGLVCYAWQAPEGLLDTLVRSKDGEYQ